MIAWRRGGVTGGRRPVRLAAEAFDDMVSSRLAAAWRFIKGFNLYAYPAGGIFMKKNCKRILGQIGDRLAAGRRFCRVQGRYAYPAGAYFCSCKSRQNTLGAVPQDPLTLKLRLDTDWAFQLPLKSRSVRRRRYALKVPAAHFLLAPAETKLKINLISVVASDATFA